MRIGFMLHSVLDDDSWDYSFLATSMKDVARLVGDLRARGYVFVMARDWPNLGSGRFASISFDDGYLDNWTILFPWMLENKVPFTVFVNRDFVSDSLNCRPLGFRGCGYLNSAEIKEMACSEIVDFQSHSCTHTWYPTSSSVIDVYHSRDKAKYPWVQWNADVSRKPDWLTYTNDAYDGFPVFENDRSLRAIRFLMPDDVVSEFSREVSTRRLSASEATELYADRYSSFGRLESEDEARSRYKEEIVGNNDFIFHLTGVRPTVLCWPGGAYNATSLEIAESLGLITTSKIGFGNEDLFLHRISPTNHYGMDRWPWKDQALTLSYYLARYKVNSVVYRVRTRIYGK